MDFERANAEGGLIGSIIRGHIGEASGSLADGRRRGDPEFADARSGVFPHEPGAWSRAGLPPAKNRGKKR